MAPGSKCEYPIQRARGEPSAGWGGACAGCSPFPEPLSRGLEHSVTGLGLEAANESNSAVFHNGQGWDGASLSSARNNSIAAAQHRQQHFRYLCSRCPGPFPAVPSLPPQLRLHERRQQVHACWTASLPPRSTNHPSFPPQLLPPLRRAAPSPLRNNFATTAPLLSWRPFHVHCDSTWSQGT